MKKILITGKSGYIATSLYKELSDRYDITCIGRDILDLTNFIDTRVYMRDRYFDVVIHTAVSGGSRLRKDNYLDMDINLSMYYNLLQNRLSYNKLIHFGSGAELYMSDEPYGLSKKVIAKSILYQDNFYNLKIFGVFDENELETRFIKGSIKRYINNEPIIIHQDKIMDFIYMPDLIKIVEYYINNNGPKEINCNYDNIISLKDIARIINSLNEYRVNIKIENKEQGKPYVGSFKDLEIKFIGLEQGIKEVYNKLK
jgi:GDP-L-fucose synthase